MFKQILIKLREFWQSKNAITFLLVMATVLIGSCYLYFGWRKQQLMLDDTIHMSAPSSSFVGETLVLTPKGMVSIKKIRLGDLVMSLNVFSQENTTSTVVDIFKRSSSDILEINRTLRVTSQHPFALVDLSGRIFWKIAEEIRVGDCLFSEKGKCIRVEDVSRVEVDTLDVYNMHVQDQENYFVFMGDTPVLVHNKQAISPEMIARANAYHGFVAEINSKYPWAHMSLENGYYAIRPEGKEEIHFQLFTGPGGEETRIPLEQIKEAVERALTASPTTAETLTEEDMKALSHEVQRPKDTPAMTQKILKIEDLLVNGGTLPWQTYVNKKYGFAFAYPTEWKLGRDRETISSYPFQSVTIDSGNALGTQIFDMQIQLRNTEKMPVLDLVRSFGSPRQYTNYGIVGGVPAIVSAPPHGHSTTVNFTSGEYFFNVDVNNIESDKLREIFDTFAFSTTSNSEDIKPSMVPLSHSIGTCTLATSKKSQAKENDGWNVFVDKDHCLGFMYPPQWMIGDASAFPAFPPPQFDETSRSHLFQHDTEIGKEMLLLNIAALNPDRVPIEELIPSLRMRDEYKHYGTIANVDAVTTVNNGVAIIRFTKGTYLFELYVKGIAPEALAGIIDTFVVLLPEPLPPQPKAPVAPVAPLPPLPPPTAPPAVAPAPPPPAIPFDGGCGPGCIIEDAGKRNVEHLPEVEALRKKYGEERLFIKALDRHLVGRETEWHTNHLAMKEHDDLLYAVRPDWDPKITGCVIVVYAGGEGFVYQEDKELNVIGTETLAEFLDHTKNVPPEMMYRFFLSLH